MVGAITIILAHEVIWGMEVSVRETGKIRLGS